MLNCAVIDCESVAIEKAKISINNGPKQLLPVCQAHFDAAKEDTIITKEATNEVAAPRYYDYKNQAWVVNGLYVRCGHLDRFDCQCFGRLHEGEKAKSLFDDGNAGIAGDILAYEAGELANSQVIRLFQRLIDNGMAWTLQGSYGRMAMKLIGSGFCVHADKR